MMIRDYDIENNDDLTEFCLIQHIAQQLNTRTSHAHISNLGLGNHTDNNESNWTYYMPKLTSIFLRVTHISNNTLSYQLIQYFS